MSAADGDSLQTHSTLMGTQVEGDAPLLPHECFKDLQEVEIFHINLLFFFSSLLFFFTGGTREEWQSVAHGSASVSWSCMCSAEHIKCGTCMNVSLRFFPGRCVTAYTPGQDRYILLFLQSAHFPALCNTEPSDALLCE